MDPYQRKTTDLSDPLDLVPASLSDTVNEDFVALGLRANTSGTVSIVTYYGATRSLIVAAGEVVRVAIRRVNSTGTTATVHLLRN